MANHMKPISGIADARRKVLESQQVGAYSGRRLLGAMRAPWFHLACAGALLASACGSSENPGTGTEVGGSSAAGAPATGGRSAAASTVTNGGGGATATGTRTGTGGAISS